MKLLFEIAVGFCVILIATDPVLSRVSYDAKVMEAEMDNEDLFVGVRLKRGVSSLISALLKTAEKIREQQHYRTYLKSGGYRQASKDFEGLEATQKINIGNVQMGNVGNRQVMMRKTPAGSEIIIWGRAANKNGEIRPVVDNIQYKD